MRRWSPSAEACDDDGSASLEFIIGGVLLLVPVVYLIVALGLVQHGTLGADAAARQAARAIALSVDAADADSRTALVVADIAAQYGLDAGDIEINVDCATEVSGCPAAGATITVTVRTRVSLPLIPPVLGFEDAAAVPIEATSVQKMSRTWGTGS